MKEHAMLADRIDQALPQTQCRECDFDACRPYAEAVASGDAEIDRCKPGGVQALNAMADIMAVDPSSYLQTVLDQFRTASVVRIDLDSCIGCLKCIQVCPVDAIVGAPKQAHVVMQDVCTGCNLCIEPCPVDCIHVETLPENNVMDRSLSGVFRQRFESRQARLDDQRQKKQQDFQKAQQLMAEEMGL